MNLLKYLIIVLLLITSVFSAEPEFTKDEIQWIKENPIVKFGADYKWPPFDFAEKSGKHTGLSSEYINLISNKSGLKFDIYAGVWANVLEDMKSKKYDGLTCAVETDDRKKYLKFTDPYLTIPIVIITSVKNKSIKTVDDLFTKVVSINKDSYIHEWLKTKYPKIKLHLLTSNEASLEAVSLDEADAYVGNQAVAAFIMNKYLLNNLKIVARLKGLETAISMAIDKDNLMLFNIVQKTLKSITPQEHQDIKSRWKKNLESDNKVLKFTKKQQDWIKKHKVIKFIADTEWRPIEYVHNGKLEGIASEYLSLVSERTGIEFQRVPIKTWIDGVNKINTREADLYSCVHRTPSREKVVNFSDSYIKVPHVFVTNKDVKFILDIESLYGKTIVAIKGYRITETLKRDYQQIKLIEVEKITDALNLLTSNGAYAFLEVLPVASYYIQQEGYSNLKISGISEYKSEYAMALRNDWGEEGIEIINMALASITQEEKTNIYNKWLHVQYDKKVDYTLLWQIAGVFMFLIIVSLFWNRKLSVEIQKKILAQQELIKLNKKLEEARDIAESANKAKSSFLSNMSHEIRTPMNAILGFAELLDDNIEDKKLKSFIKTIRSSGQTLLFLINDILDLSKIESGKLKLVKSKVNIQNIFEETISIFKLEAEKKGLKLELELDTNIPVSLLLDPIRFKEILINLIGNALKFTEKGYIKVVVIVDNVYEHTSKIDLRIRVEDSGIGIKKSQQDKIFNIFEQTENQDIRKYGGTGLGLAICKKLTMLMNGSLDVKSKPGVGSKFIVSFKDLDIVSMSDEESMDESNIDFSTIEFNSAVILVVDDVKENRDLIIESFSGTNIKVLEAVNGKEAVNISKKMEPDLILMDIRMPVMDGYSATRLIKNFSKAPVIALTASIMQEELKKLEGGRFNGYLRKPVSKNKLFKEISNFLTVVDTDFKEEIIIDDFKELNKFLEALKDDMDDLYQEAKSTNDLSIIAKFSKALFELSLKHNIDYMIRYSELLLEKIDTFEIDSISVMLNDYESKIEKLIRIMKKLKSQLT